MKNLTLKIIFFGLILMGLFLSVNYAMATTNSACYSGTGLCVTKKVINLTSGNLNWQSSVNANPYDILSFAITLQAGNTAVNNINIKEYLPNGLIYSGNLLVNSSLNYSGNPIDGIYIGTIPANGVAVVSYQARVSPQTGSFYGTTLLNAESVITSSQEPSQTLSAQVFVNNQQIYYGATYLSTGITNNFIKDSFFLPLFLIALFSWLYFTGRVYKFSDWIAKKYRKQNGL